MAQTHLIVGAGNMGGALLSGWVSKSIVSPRNFAILDPSPGVEAVYAIERGAAHLGQSEDIAATTQVVLLAVKPQTFATIATSLAEHIPEDALILSIMAGISLSALRAVFTGHTIVRAMPNTPAAIGQGITAYVPPDDASESTIEMVEQLLGSTGTVVRVASDTQLNAVTAVSGSGPAYIFHLCEALTSAGISAGLEPDTASDLARQTIIGSGALLKSSDRSAQELREAVTSPGGTTQAALDVLMGADGLSDLMRQAVLAAFRRAGELSD